MKPAVLYHTEQATETRREILQAAVDIASAEGLEGLSTESSSAPPSDPLN
jgi:AcrR family transcriptional regulator